jgi:hypothetical protein
MQHKDKKDKRGRFHEYYRDVDAANLSYDKEERDMERDKIENIRKNNARAAIAADEQIRLLAKTAWVARAQLEATRKQNQLLEEQNRLLMMTPEERSAYKERLEQNERQKLVALLNARLQEQRRKAEEAAYWNSPAGVEAWKLAEEKKEVARKRAEEQKEEVRKRAEEQEVEARKLAEERAKRKEEQDLYLIIKEETEGIAKIEELIANSSGFGALKIFFCGGVTIDDEQGSKAIDSCRSKIAQAKEQLKLVEQKIKQYQ